MFALRAARPRIAASCAQQTTASVAALPSHRAFSAFVASAPAASSSSSSWSSAVSSSCFSSLRLSTPHRSLHTSSTTLGGGSSDHHSNSDHGHDFLERDNVVRRVLMVLNGVSKIDKSKLKDLDSSFKSLGLDSLDEVEIIMMLEDEFVIDIQDEIATSLLTINDTVNYVCNHPFAANDEH